VVLIYFIRRRRDVPFHWVFWMFGVFILSCGVTHLLEVVNTYLPLYRLSGVVKGVTALASWATVIALVPLVPKALALRSPEELEREVAARRRAEDALQQANAGLERRVQDRTAELLRANEALRAEVEERNRAEQRLRDSEARFRQLADAMPQIVWTAGPDGRCDYWNKRWYEFTGFSVPPPGSPDDYWTRVLHPEDTDRCLQHWYQAVNTGEAYEVEYRFKDRRSGGYRWHLGRALPVRDQAGRTVRWFGTCTDIDDQKRAENQLRELNAALEQGVAERTAALREEEERFRTAFDFAPIGMALVAPDGRWLRVNRSLCELVGYGEPELLATDFQHITHPEDLDANLVYFRQVLAGMLPAYQMEKRYRHKAGHSVHVLLSVSLVRDGQGDPLYFIAQMQDITGRKKAEEQTHASLREKEVLLKEIHHRVKNNLQVISSLLQLQCQHTHDPASAEMFRESQHRVRSMALVHERLYRTRDLVKVDFADYIENLANHLFASYKVDSERITLAIDVHGVRLSIDAAVPCGLLVNELVSNCLKHAFRGRERGRIRIELLPVGAGEALLHVGDDGVGLPQGVGLDTTGSFGMELVAAMVDQLHGTVAIDRHGGTAYRIVFPLARQPAERTSPCQAADRTPPFTRAGQLPPAS
jgi:PAS domain S-box-containing protein